MQLYEVFSVRGLTVEDFLHCFKRNFVNKHYNYKKFKIEKEALYDKVVEYFQMNNSWEKQFCICNFVLIDLL